MSGRTRATATVLGLLLAITPLVPVEASAPKIRLASRTSDGPRANASSFVRSTSGDGRFVAFQSRADNLPGGDGSTTLVYLRDQRTNTTRLVSRVPGGPAADDTSTSPSVSADGRFVAFSSQGANLPGGDGMTRQIYLYNRIANTLRLVSRVPGGPAADEDSFRPSVSADGRFVAFESRAANLPGGDGSTSLVYLYNRITNTLRLVSKASNGDIADGNSFEPATSADGRFVAFTSSAANLPGGDGGNHLVFIHDRKTSATRLVSRTSNGPRSPNSFLPAISADGRFVAFVSRAANLPGGDGSTNLVYLRDRMTNKTKLVSRTSEGPKANGDSGGEKVSISADGRFVAFPSVAANLPGGDGSTSQVYLRDLRTNTTRLVSRISGGPAADGHSIDPDVTADGRFVAFSSQADNLPAGDGTTWLAYLAGPF